MQYYPMQHKPRKLSVIGAMKDIQQYKIMKTQADLAPTLAEKARIEWDWKKKDRTRDIQIEETALEAGQLSNVAKKRELMTEILTESAQIAKDAFEKTTTQEEFTAYLQNAYTRLKEKGPQYADELEDKDGNNIIDLAEIPREKAMEIHAGFLARKEKLVPVAAGTRMIDPETGGVVVEAEYKPTAKEKGFITLQDPSNPDNTITKRRGDPAIDGLLKKGWTEVKTPAVTINMPDTLSKTMKAKLQAEMFARQQSIDRLDQIERLTKDEYLTYWGKGKAKVSEMITKAGIATEQMADYAADYEEWATSTKAHTLLWRKLITGVAGGEKEMKAIEEVSINVGDSAPTFRRKLRRQKTMAQVAFQRAKFSIEHFGELFEDLTPEQQSDIQERFPLLVSLSEQDADSLLKQLGYE